MKFAPLKESGGEGPPGEQGEDQEGPAARAGGPDAEAGQAEEESQGGQRLLPPDPVDEQHGQEGARELGERRPDHFQVVPREKTPATKGR